MHLTGKEPHELRATAKGFIEAAKEPGCCACSCTGGALTCMLMGYPICTCRCSARLWGRGRGGVQLNLEERL